MPKNVAIIIDYIYHFRRQNRLKLNIIKWKIVFPVNYNSIKLIKITYKSSECYCFKASNLSRIQRFVSAPSFLSLFPHFCLENSWLPFQSPSWKRKSPKSFFHRPFFLATFPKGWIVLLMTTQRNSILNPLKSIFSRIILKK